MNRLPSLSGGPSKSSLATSSKHTTTAVSTTLADSDEDSDIQRSDEEDNDFGDINEAEATLNKLRRGAKKRRTRGGAFNRLEKLQSLENVQRAHAFKRMEEGLRTILSLHTPVELSSICGTLLLKAQLKAATSIEQIIKYALKDEEFSTDILDKVFNAMWEEPLWEYLHSIGHPTHSMRIEPRRTILEIWEKGGLLDGAVDGFTPHFISRQVKKRNDWITSPDILSRVTQIREAQELAKKSERKVISEHDYTNILTYFKDMNKLRSLETSTREFLSSELEVARSRLDSGSQTNKMLREQLQENEQLYMRVVNSLNDELSFQESVAQRHIDCRLEMELAVQRVDLILQNYMECALDRARCDGGGMQPLRLKAADKEFPPFLRSVVSRLEQYRDLREEQDDALRFRARCHVEDNRALRAENELLRESLAQVQQRESALNDKFQRLLYEYALSERKAAREAELNAVQQKVAWHTAMHRSSQASRHAVQCNKVKPLLLAALRHSHATVRAMGSTLLQTLDILQPTDAPYREAVESAQMQREDAASEFRRQMERYLAQKELRPSTNASKKIKSSKSSSTAKKSKARDDVSVSSASVKESKSVKGKSAEKSSKSNASEKPTTKSPTKGKSVKKK